MIRGRMTLRHVEEEFPRMGGRAAAARAREIPTEGVPASGTLGD